MIRPDFRDYKNHGGELMHSAKGSTWENHKYLRKEGNRYIYTFPKKAKVGTKNVLKEVVDYKRVQREVEEAEKKYKATLATAKFARKSKNMKAMIDAAAKQKIAKETLEKAKKDLQSLQNPRDKKKVSTSTGINLKKAKPGSTKRR